MSTDIQVEILDWVGRSEKTNTGVTGLRNIINQSITEAMGIQKS